MMPKGKDLRISDTAISLPQTTRARFVSWMSILAAVSGVLTGIFELRGGQLFMGFLDLTISLVLLIFGLLSIFYSRLHGAAANILVIAGTLLLLISFVTGGLDNSSAAWLGLVPVVAVFVYGWKKALWISVGFVVYILLAYVFFADLIAQGPAYTPVAVRQIILVLVTYYLAAAYFDSRLEGSQSELAIRLQDLNTANQKLANEIQQEKKLKAELAGTLDKLQAQAAGEEDARRAMLNLLEDIQEEKEKSQELSKRFMLATQSAQIGVWEYDLESKELVWDEMMYKLYQLEGLKKPIDFESWRELFLPEDRDRRDRAIADALVGKQGYNDVFRFTTKTGAVRYVQASALVTRDAAGKPLKLVGVNWDITREQEIDKAKSEFVSLASHQLRTPLSTVGWYAEMLLDGDAGKLNPEQLEYVREIQKGNTRMVELVNALLNVSRLELGTFVIEPEAVSLLELTEEVLKEQQPQISAKHQNLQKEFSKTDIKLSVDRRLCRMVMQNFLSNAVKYTPEQGSVSVGLKYLNEMPKNFQIFGKSNDVLFYVKDTGIGIPKQQQDKIFEKLYRADNAKVLDSDGTGLGLYIAKTIVEESGGKIWFESKEGFGSTFYALLPSSGMRPKKGSKSLS